MSLLSQHLDTLRADCLFPGGWCPMMGHGWAACFLGTASIPIGPSVLWKSADSGRMSERRREDQIGTQPVQLERRRQTVRAGETDKEGWPAQEFFSDRAPKHRFGRREIGPHSRWRMKYPGEQRHDLRRVPLGKRDQHD